MIKVRIGATTSWASMRDCDEGVATDFLVAPGLAVIVSMAVTSAVVKLVTVLNVVFWEHDAFPRGERDGMERGPRGNSLDTSQ